MRPKSELIIDVLLCWRRRLSRNLCLAAKIIKWGEKKMVNLMNYRPRRRLFLWCQIKNWPKLSVPFTELQSLRSIDLCMKRETKVTPEFLLVKSSENDFIFLPAYYLIIWLMKAKKNFEKIAILKTQGLVSFWGVKTHFGKMPLKWCIFRHEKIKILSNICRSFWSN